MNKHRPRASIDRRLGARQTFRKARITTAFALPLLLCSNLSAARAKLLPVDEAAKDPSLVEFREKLKRAATSRDLEFVLSVLDPEIKNSFGGDDGIDGFQRIWDPAKPDTPLWPTLLRVLSMGGSFYRNEAESGFIAPYVNSTWPSGFDAFDYAAITGKNVNLRATPSSKARVLAKLSYDIVKLEGDLHGEGTAWVKVKTAAGVAGFVSQDLIYSPIGYRIYMVKREGSWRIKIFVAGD